MHLSPSNTSKPHSKTYYSNLLPLYLPNLIISKSLNHPSPFHHIPTNKDSKSVSISHAFTYIFLINTRLLIILNLQKTSTSYLRNSILTLKLHLLTKMTNLI